MKFVVITAVVVSSISLAGCFGTASLGSLSRTPGTPKLSSLEMQDCVHVTFPQCSEGQ
jgi:outer membrane murein-binding lipoprotein Lpp